MKLWVCDGYLLVAVDTVMSMLGEKADVWGGVDNEDVAVLRMMETEDGVKYCRSTALLESVSSAQMDMAKTLASRNFRNEWKNSIDDPIKNIGDRFCQLLVSGRLVVETERVGPAIEQELHEILHGMDDNYSPALSMAEDLKKLVCLSVWLDKPWLCTPYSISIQRCDDASCYIPFKAQTHMRAIVMQMQPTPRIDPNRPGLFLSHNDALNLLRNKPTTLNDLSDLPSMQNTDKKVIEACKVKTAKDVEVNNDLKLGSCDKNKANGILKCFNCNKPRCYFSQSNNDEYGESVEILQ